jgi:hypothetical protein
MYTATFKRQKPYGVDCFGVVKYKAQTGRGRELKAFKGRETELNTAAIGNNNMMVNVEKVTG